MKIFNTFQWYGYKHYPLHALLIAKPGDIITDEELEVDLKFEYLLDEAIYPGVRPALVEEVKAKDTIILITLADFRVGGAKLNGKRFLLPYRNEKLDFGLVEESKRDEMIPTILLAYGCGRGCSFCYVRNYFEKRKLEVVLEEFEFFKNAGYFEFYDNNINRKDVVEFLEVIKEKGWLKHRFSGLVVIDEHLEDFVSLFIKYGGLRLHLGVEDIKKRDFLNKYYMKKNIPYLDLVERSLKEGIRWTFFVMYGLKEQTFEDVIFTMNFLKQYGSLVCSRYYVFDPFRMDLTGMKFRQVKEYSFVVEETEWMSKEELEKLDELARKENEETSFLIYKEFKEYYNLGFWKQ